MVRVSIRPRVISLVAAATGCRPRAARSGSRSGSAGCPGSRGRQTTTFPCPAAVRGCRHGGGASAVRVQAAGLCVPARGRGAAFEGGTAGRDAGPGRGGRDRCVRRGAVGCGHRSGPGWRWPALFACRGDAAAGRECIWRSPVRAAAGSAACVPDGGCVPDGLGPACCRRPGHFTGAVRDQRAVVIHGSSGVSPAAFALGADLRDIGCLPRRGMADARVTWHITIAVPGRFVLFISRAGKGR